MSGRVQDKVAIVFGAGQSAGGGVGNGRAAALLYARHGAKVVCVDRSLSSAEETSALIVNEGGISLATDADATQEHACERAIQFCMANFGRLDILHNNIGAAPGDVRDIVDLPALAIDQIVAINLKSMIFACKHALPIMRQQGSGSIVSISSVSAVCSAEPVMYKTTKLAMNGLTQQLALANAPYGIRVNAILPGLMDTPMAIEGAARHMDLAVDEVRAQRNARVALRGRMGTAWDVAHAALFLSSDDAAFITGVLLPVDGGQTASIGW